MTKLMKMSEAIGRFVNNGDMVVIEGFTHLICFAAAHEIIRQQRRELTVCRLTPDLIYDQLIGAGCIRKPLEFRQMFVERLACARPLERRPDEERPLDGGRDGDQISCDGLASIGAWCRRAR